MQANPFSLVSSNSRFCFLEDEHQIKSRHRNVTAAFLENVLNDCEEEYVWNNVLESNNRQFEKHLSCECHDLIETQKPGQYRGFHMALALFSKTFQPTFFET